MSFSIANLHCFFSIFERSSFVEQFAGHQTGRSGRHVRSATATTVISRGYPSWFPEGAVGVARDPASTLFCSRLHSAASLTSKA